MAVEGDRDDVLTYTRTWFDPLNDNTFTLFTSIENVHFFPNTCLILDLTRRSSKRLLMIKYFVMKMLISLDIAVSRYRITRRFRFSPNRNFELMGIRGYSIAASWMEVYKGNEKKNTKKSTGLYKATCISGTAR